MKIRKVLAREILDSRGNPTVEVDVVTDNGFGRAAAPSGASTGSREALELRDGGKRFLGKGVRKAVTNAKRIGRKLTGIDPTDQNHIDNIIIKDAGGESKKLAGANATVALSLATCAAGAYGKGLPIYEYLNPKARLLPVPQMNIINGGKHAGDGLAIQEFMIIPHGFKSFSEALRAGAETYHILGRLLETEYGGVARNVGDEGGFAPPIRTTEEALEAIVKAVIEAGYENRISIGIDAAATSFHSVGHYRIDGQTISARELMRKYEDLIKRYPIISIEDPFEENDFDSLAQLTRENGIQVVGDDYFVSNVRLVSKAVQRGAGNAMILKVNQVGTLTEAMNAAELAKRSGWNVIVSHRSGETENTFIADLAVALGCGQIKTGAPCRGERTAKYNQLLRIEERLGKKAKFAKI